ncbi:sporulation protein [Paenisporosarcina indica]|uniref:sporulation protein n=1 Tax=Paenisporosarcina indica TaxID=650093 RepID=UPI0009501387|nr:sporulation protein [Paenisporosarcina indica]
MSIFHKVLASVGVGNAKVDTKLNNSTFVAGEMISGVTEVVGGNVSQSVDSIYIKVYTTYEREANDKKYTDSVAVSSFKLNEPFSIEKDEKKVFPFSFNLPLITPVTMGKTRVWLQTGLDIKNAVDPGDKDMIEVRPNAFIQAGLTAAQNLGLKLRKVDCEEAPRAYKGLTKFVQEFEFVPASGPFRGKFDEVELTFIPKGLDQVELLIQVDRKVRGLSSLFSEALNMDESFIRLILTKADLATLESRLHQEFTRYS